MTGPRARRPSALVVALAASAVLAACVVADSPSGSAASSAPGLTATPQPTASPSPTPVVPTTFPLAIVTGITNLKSAITLDELVALADRRDLLMPCGVEVVEP